MGKIKKISPSDFDEVQKRNWQPVKLEGEAIPALFENIPPEKLHSIYASGCFVSQMPCESQVLPSGTLIGGIDVYRNAPDDPVDLNKDWYAVVYNGDKSGALLVQGPFKPEDHWLNSIPQRLQNAEIVGCPGIDISQGLS